MPLIPNKERFFKGKLNKDNLILSKEGYKMRLNDHFKINKDEKRLLKAVIYTLFVTSKEVNIKEAMIRASERFKVSTSDIDQFINDLFSIEL